jgi:ER membrane protein complex subunit 2
LLPQTIQQSKSEDEASLLDIKTVQLLNQKATAKLAEIVRRGVGGEAGWQGYDPAELIAARELLDRDVTHVPR